MRTFINGVVLLCLGSVISAQANIVNIVWQGPGAAGGLALGAGVQAGGVGPGCGPLLAINGVCAADAVINVGIDPTIANPAAAIGIPFGGADQFMLNLNSTAVNIGGISGLETLTATVIDVTGGAGSIEIDSLQDYSLLAAFPLLAGFGTLNGNCNVNTIVGDSISGTVRLDGVVAPVLTLNCPLGGTAGNVIIGPTATGLVVNAAVVAEFDIAALFTFAAGTPAGAVESIPISLTDAPEPNSFGLVAGGAVFAIGAMIRRRNFNAN